jgi:hypothetical protein
MRSLFFALTALLFAQSAMASFVSDFVRDVENNVAGEYYEYQGRGYATMGSYTVRSKNTVIHPVSITPPSVNIGCNGIDIVGGGISFLGPNELKKVYDQLTNPSTLMYVGTSLAMKMLSNELADTIEVAMDKIQQINNMQLDGCAIANAGVSLVTDASYQAEVKAKMSNAVDSVNSMFYDSSDKAVKAQQSSAPADVQARKIQTATTLQNFSAKEYFDTGGSLLEYLINKWVTAGMSTTEFSFPGKVVINQLRALYGDIYYNSAAGTFITIQPCELELLDIEINYYVKPAGVSASCATTSEKSIDAYTRENMSNMLEIYEGIGGNGADMINFTKALQNTNVYIALINAAGGEKYQINSSVLSLTPVAKAELAFVYANMYYNDMISLIDRLKADSEAYAGDYSPALSSKINEFKKTAATKQRLFEQQRDYMLTRYDAYLRGKGIEKFPDHENNPLGAKLATSGKKTGESE